MKKMYNQIVLRKTCIVFLFVLIKYGSAIGDAADTSTKTSFDTLFPSSILSSLTAQSLIIPDELSVVTKLYQDCQDTQDFTKCLKEKALNALGKAIDQESITISDGISLMRQKNITDINETPSITNARSLNQLNGIDKELMLNLDTFLRSHVIRIDLDESTESGRGKKEKELGKYAMAAFFTAMGIAAPLGLKAIGAIAVKALVVSKIALTIAGLIALKKIFSSDHHHSEDKSIQVVAAEDEHHNRRNSYYIRRPNSNNNNVYHSSRSKNSIIKDGSLELDPYRYYYYST